MAPKRYPDVPAASSDDETEEQEEDSSDQEQHDDEESEPQKIDPEQDEDESEESDDETEEQEEEPSDEEQQQQQPGKDEDESEESGDDEEEPGLLKQSVEKYPSASQSESSEGSGSDSDSDSEGTQNSLTASAFTIKPIAYKPMEISPKPKKPSSKPTQLKQPSTKRPVETEQQNGSGSDSDSDSEGTQNSLTASAFTIKPIASKPMEISPKPKKPSSKPTQLKQPSTKRPVETEQNGSGSMNKKSKVSNGDGEDGPGKKSALIRLWSEDDEIVILKGMIDYLMETDADPYSDMAAFHEFVKDSLSVDVSKSQLTEKIRRLKKKYQNNAEKGGNGKDTVFSKPHEYKTFELSKKIWDRGVGIDGMDDSKVSNGKRKDKKDDKVVNNSVMKQTKEERMDFWSMYPRLSESLESEASVYLSMPKDVKNFVKERISLLGREKVSQLEEKWKDIRVMECNLYAKRLELIHEQNQMAFDEMKP